MWIVFGTKVQTERIPGGKQVQRQCEHCGEVAMFYERRAVSKLQLYFLDVLDYEKRTVMACGACGTLYGTDEVGAVEAPDAGDAVQKIVGTAKGAFGRLSEAARTGFERVREEAERALEPEPRGTVREREATDDPLADDEAALEAKFREIEKKYGGGD